MGLLSKLARKGRETIDRIKFVITKENGEPYLTRYYLVRTERLGIYLHCVHASDADRELHDHPWSFVSFLLWGSGYTEVYMPLAQVQSERYFPPFSINARMDPAAPHRLRLPVDDSGREIPQWTLVFVGRKRREWGFHVPMVEARERGLDDGAIFSCHVDNAVWVDHRDFLDEKFGKGQWVPEPGYHPEERRAKTQPIFGSRP